MANGNKDIGEIVKKCKILLLDIEGTTTSISFVKDKLFPYAEENVKQFLEGQWDSDDVKEAIIALRKLAVQDKENSVEGLVAIPDEDAAKEEQIEGLVNNVKWQMSLDRKVGPLKAIQGLIWRQGYDNGDIKGHVYDDVSAALKQWRSTEGHKIYIYSSGSVEAQKLLFGQSLAGDLLPLIDGHFDTAVGAKQEAASYVSIVEKIGCKADEILFLTDITKEAEAARASGLHAALVSREGNAPLTAEAADSFPVIHSFEQLTVTNKRKPDPQEEIPAKVPKTDLDNDTKTNTDNEENKVTPVIEETKHDEKPEQMEVEDAPVKDNAEPTDSEILDNTRKENPHPLKDTDAPISEVEPIITEEEDSSGKTEQNETESMDAETTENEPKENISLKNVDANDAPVAEETPAVVTEIEDISDKQDLADVAEVIDDLEPVVEEPPAEDLEDLQNVGDVLAKECDEILSKVQDVTNLDNIPLKPLLNTITEEMETENTDSNDIVDRILDTELELENLKQCDEIDLNTVQEITDHKTETVEEKSEKVEPSVTNDVPVVEEEKVEAKSAEVVDSIDKTDGNVVSSPKDTENEKLEVKEVESESAEPEKPAVESTVAPVEESVASAEEPAEKKDEVENVKVNNDHSEKHVNGKATNGDAEVNLNGDASKDEELSARLSVEKNGKEMNGSNGDANGTDKGEDKAEEVVADIKVKTVAVEEPRTDPIEQPTEA